MITPSTNRWKDMKTFIELSKIWREKYKTTLPFIYVMAKRPMREDLQRTITDYIVFKAMNS